MLREYKNKISEHAVETSIITLVGTNLGGNLYGEQIVCGSRLRRVGTGR